MNYSVIIQTDKDIAVVKKFKNVTITDILLFIAKDGYREKDILDIRKV